MRLVVRRPGPWFWLCTSSLSGPEGVTSTVQASVFSSVQWEHWPQFSFLMEL